MATGEIATAEHCAICYESLYRHFEPTTPRVFSINPDSKPLFVTWNKHGSLRGCIGTFAEVELPQGLEQYALTSALKDSRFAPVNRDELSHLECAVSLLHQFEPAANAYDWQVGHHGIIIDFTVKEHSYRATYLPEVASEQGWDQDECLDSLIRKAGFRGKIDDKFKKGLSVTRYQSSKSRLDHSTYLQMRAERG